MNNALGLTLIVLVLTACGGNKHDSIGSANVNIASSTSLAISTSFSSSISSANLASSTSRSGLSSAAATGNTQCNLSRPVCSLTADPVSDLDRRLSSGTNVFIMATCNTSITESVWLKNSKQFASGVLSTNAIVTALPNTVNYDAFRFNYANCAGNGSVTIPIYTENIAPSAGNSSTATSVGASSVASSANQPVNDCLDVTRNTRNIAVAKNICSKKVDVSWCTQGVGKDWDYSCRAVAHKTSPTGFIYGRGSVDISAGGSYTLSGTQDVDVAVAACYSPDFTFISSVSAGTFTSYCN